MPYNSAPGSSAMSCLIEKHIYFSLSFHGYEYIIEN